MLHGYGVVAIPPGETVKELLDDRKLSLKDFSSKMGMSESAITKLLDGEIFLTPEIASRLERVLGPGAYFWSGLETLYRDKLNIILTENKLYTSETV